MRQDVVLAEALDAPLLTGGARFTGDASLTGGARFTGDASLTGGSRFTGASRPEREIMLVDAPG